LTKFEFTITIGASALNVAAQAFLGTVGTAYPKGWKNAYGTSFLTSAKLSFQMAPGSTGEGYVGNASVTNAGANSDYVLAPGSGANPGGYSSVESQTDENIIDLSQYYVHGSNAGDTVTVSYSQV